MPSSEAMPGHQLQLSRICSDTACSPHMGTILHFFLPSSFSFIKPRCPGSFLKGLSCCALGELGAPSWLLLDVRFMSAPGSKPSC